MKELFTLTLRFDIIKSKINCIKGERFYDI